MRTCSPGQIVGAEVIMVIYDVFALHSFVWDLMEDLESMQPAFLDKDAAFLAFCDPARWSSINSWVRSSSRRLKTARVTHINRSRKQKIHKWEPVK